MKRNKLLFVLLFLSTFCFGNKDATRITSDGKLVLNYKTKIADFVKNVKVKTENGFLKSDTLTVFFDSQGNEIEKMIAIGNVFIEEANHQAEGERAEYHSKNGKLILSGDPLIKKGENYYSAEVITIDTNTSKVYFEPSAKIVIRKLKNEVES